jgi:tetratricopeptide (TPR) repeat protein
MKPVSKVNKKHKEITTGSKAEKSTVKKILYLFIILLLTFVVYGPARNGKLTNWDDDRYITNNIDITSFKKYKSNLLTKPYQGNYHPLTMLSYTYDYSIGKLNPKVYHRTNIILHLVNSALVFWLVILLIGNPEVALVCGILFGIHPLHVESVAWVSERKDVLYGLFFLASLIAYAKYLKANEAKFYILALVLFICSLLSKGMAVSLTVTLFAIDYLFQRNLLNKKVLLEKIPFFLLSIAFGLIAVYVQELDPSKAAPLKTPFYEKVIYAGHNLTHYVYKLFIPIKLAIFYPYPEKDNGVLPWHYYIIPVLTILFLITCFVMLVKNKKPYAKQILFCILFFVINIALVLQLLPVGDAIMADRYSYIPSIGLFLLIGLSYKYLSENKPQLKNSLAALLAVFCLALSYLAYQRCEVWKDSISIWTDEIEKFPNQSFAYNNRGIVKYELNDLKGALADYEKCIQLDPSTQRAYNNKGIIEAINGDYQAAIKDFDKAIKGNSDYADAYKNRGKAKFEIKDYKGTVEDYASYLKFNPVHHEVYANKGLAEFHMKEYKNAILDFNKAIEIAPEFIDPYINRGMSKAALQDFQGAINDYDKVVELNPGYYLAYYNKAAIKFSLKLNEEGCANLQKAAAYGHPTAGEEFERYCK